MVLPFRDEPDGKGLTTVLKEILLYLSSTLMREFNTHLGVGGFLSSWTAYQAELAAEETLWGHPLSHTDKKWSVSLGTDVALSVFNDMIKKT